MDRLIRILGAAMILAALGSAFFAYFVRSFDDQSYVWRDGLGRQLAEAPWLMQALLDHGSGWAGWTWFFVDIVVFWALIGVGFRLSSRGAK